MCGVVLTTLPVAGVSALVEEGAGEGMLTDCGGGGGGGRLLGGAEGTLVSITYKCRQIQEATALYLWSDMFDVHVYMYKHTCTPFLELNILPTHNFGHFHEC